MKPIDQIRRENFARAIAEHCNDLQTVAADRLGYSTPSLVSRYIKGGKGIGSGTARKIERTFGLPSFWMDADHTAVLSTRGPEFEEIGAVEMPTRRVPVVGEVKGGLDGYLETLTLVNDGIELLTHSRDPQAYGLRIRGDSMRPRFKPGEYLLIEPSTEPQVGEDVVIALVDGRKLLKELIIEREDEIEVTSVNNGDRLTIERVQIETIHRVSGHFPRVSGLVQRR